MVALANDGCVDSRAREAVAGHRILWHRLQPNLTLGRRAILQEAMKSMQNHCVRAFLVAGGIAMFGCSAPLEPGDVAGTYVLARVDGVAMPATISIGGGTLRILHDTVILRADGSSYVAREYGLVPGSGLTGFQNFSGEGTYELDGATIALSPPLCQTLACGQWSTRHLSRIGGRVREADATLGTLEYERLGPPAP